MTTGGYGEVLRMPGAARVFLPALVGRLSLAMVTLALLFAVQEHTGSFAVAGAATGAFGLANVLASPYRARLVDRWGQRATLNTLAVGYTIGLGGLGLLVTIPGSPAWSLVALAGVTGLFPPPLGAAMRVLWGSIADRAVLRTRAYSLDAVAEELLFTVGPLIVAAIMTVTSPTAGLLLTAVAALAGTLGMTSSAVSRRQVASAMPVLRPARPLRQPGFIPVLVALLAAGIVLGTVEVAAPAFASEVGSITLAGGLLSAFAAGSAIGGLLYGRHAWRSPLQSRLLLLGGAMAVLCGALALAPTVVLLAIGLATVGFFLAPSLVTGYLLADELTAPGVRTEASSWINTALNAGAAVAAAGIGVVADTASPIVGFVVGAAGALGCLLVASRFLLSRHRTPRR